jgi:hypothetical protein
LVLIGMSMATTPTGTREGLCGLKNLTHIGRTAGRLSSFSLTPTSKFEKACVGRRNCHDTPLATPTTQ